MFDEPIQELRPNDVKSCTLLEFIASVVVVATAAVAAVVDVVGEPSSSEARDTANCGILSVTKTKTSEASFFSSGTLKAMAVYVSKCSTICLAVNFF